MTDNENNNQKGPSYSKEDMDTHMHIPISDSEMEQQIDQILAKEPDSKPTIEVTPGEPIYSEKDIDQHGPSLVSSDHMGELVVVTGAAGGLGKLVADDFYQKGAEVLRLDVVEGEGIVQLDLRDRECGQKFLDVLNKNYSGVEPLQVKYFFGNAGLQQQKPISGTSQEDLDAILDVNLRANLLLYQALVGAREVDGQRLNVMANGGTMVFSGSVASYGNRGQAVYAATKAGLRGLVLCHQYDLDAHDNRGIRAVCVELPFTKTSMTDRIFKVMGRTLTEKGMEYLESKDLIIPAEQGADLLVRAAKGEIEGPVYTFPRTTAAAEVLGYADFAKHVGLNSYERKLRKIHESMKDKLQEE